MNEIDKYYNELLNLSGKVTTAFSILPILVGAVFYKRFFTKPLKIFFWYLVVRFSLNVLMEVFIWSANKHYLIFWKPIFKALQIENTLFFNGFFFLNNFILIGFFYYTLLNIDKKTQWLKYLTIGLSIFEVINYFFIDGFRQFGMVGPIVVNSFTVLLPCYYLWHLSNSPPNLPILKNTYFWISLSLFIAHLIAFLFMFTGAKLYETDFALYCKTSILRNFVEISSQIGFIFAFTKSKYLKYL
jgi:hypothetical protein